MKLTKDLSRKSKSSDENWNCTRYLIPTYYLKICKEKPTNRVKFPVTSLLNEMSLPKCSNNYIQNIVVSKHLDSSR